MTSGIIPYYKGFRSSCFVYAHRIVSCMLKDKNGVSHDSHHFFVLVSIVPVWRLFHSNKNEFVTIAIQVIGLNGVLVDELN